MMVRTDESGSSLVHVRTFSAIPFGARRIFADGGGGGGVSMAMTTLESVWSMIAFVRGPT